jgi:hypothetical protein
MGIAPKMSRRNARNAYRRDGGSPTVQQQAEWALITENATRCAGTLVMG